MHYNHMLVSMDCRLLLDRIVRLHLGGDAVLYTVLYSTGMSVGSLLSANKKTMDCLNVL